MKKHIYSIIAVMLLVCLVIPAGEATAAAASSTTAAGRSASIVTLPGNGIEPKIFTASGVITDDTPVGNLIKEATANGNVLAMVNGAYFNAYYDKGATISFPDNCPNTWNALVSGGKVLRSGDGVTLGYTKDGKWLIDIVAVNKKLIRDDGREYAVWGVNSFSDNKDSIIIYTPELGLPIPVHNDSVVFTIKNGTIESKRSGLSQVVVQAGTEVAVFGSAAYENGARWGNQLEVGMKVSLPNTFKPSKTSMAAEWEKVTFCVTVGPYLIKDGVDVSGDATLNRNFQTETHRGSAQRTFIGVTKDNHLIIGAAVTTHADAAATLKARGCVDAMALDGGASSFLYGNGRTLQNAGRDLNNVIAFMGTSAAARSEPPAANRTLAAPTTSTVYVNGAAKAFESYNIGGSTYFKLRDLAYALNGTNKQFSVGYDGATRAITLTSGKAYTVVGGEIEGVATAEKAALAALSNIVVIKDGETLDLTVYGIGGNTFFRLRDLMSAFDVNVGYDPANSAITIDTTRSYG